MSDSVENKNIEPKNDTLYAILMTEEQIKFVLSCLMRTTIIGEHVPMFNICVQAIQNPKGVYTSQPNAEAEQKSGE
jgi:hypothetical protein